MKMVALITGITPSSVGQDIFNELLQRFPSEHASNRMYVKWTEYDQEEYYQIVSLLDDAGLSMWNRIGPPNMSSEYTVYVRREYDEYDLSESTHLVLLGCKPDGRVVELAKGAQSLGGTAPIIADSTLELGKIFARTRYPFWVLCSDAVRNILDNNIFNGIRFCSTDAYERVSEEECVPKQWGEYEESWWEVDSHVEMPALSPSINLVAAKRGASLRTDFSTGCRIDTGIIQPELHYLRSDIQSVDDFDVCRTHEPISGYIKWSYRDRALIVSQRFYQYCKKNNIKAEWWPVRIDED